MKWRQIYVNRIQTHSKEVFLWDKVGGVAVRVPVPSRPWRNISDDFSHWCSAEGYGTGEFPACIPAGVKPNPVHFDILVGLPMEAEDGTLFLKDKEGDIISL